MARTVNRHGLWDGDRERAWTLGWVAHEAVDNPGSWEVYEDDGEGYGDMVAGAMPRDEAEALVEALAEARTLGEVARLTPDAV